MRTFNFMKYLTKYIIFCVDSNHFGVWKFDAFVGLSSSKKRFDDIAKFRLSLFLPVFLLFFVFITAFPQSTEQVPPSVDLRMYNIIGKVSPERIKNDITTLVGFGTRHTLSDTVSSTRGIGAARRWIEQEFEQISKESNGKLEVFYQNNLVKKDDKRIFRDVWVNNVIAIQKGRLYPDRYVIISGDIDSRASDVNNSEIDAPGANDNASGIAGVLEAARILSKYEFNSSIVYAALSGEEQGLFGGIGLANYAGEKGWKVIGVLNNDMIGNIEGINGVIDNRSFRIFSEPVPPGETDADRNRRRFMGGEVDGISRQLARYITAMTQKYMPELNPVMIYRLDRFGRGGHHKPFNDLGYAAVRIMEAHENYNRQHQDVRTENGIHYGDVLSGVNFGYAAKLTAVNAIALAGLAWAPAAPEHVKIGGAVSPSTILSWDSIANAGCIGYKIYWRETTAPQWQYARFVGKVNSFTLTDVIIDDYFFGVAAVGEDGNESPVVFPTGMIR